MTTQANLRQAINLHYHADETVCIQHTLSQLTDIENSASTIEQHAHQLVKHVRDTRLNQGGMDAFMQHYDLSTEEGVALMCIAEAMLRIPDKKTAAQLIQDKLAPLNWRSHLGGSTSTFVNAATWALMLTGKIITDHQQHQRTMRAALHKLVKHTSQPTIRQAIGQAMRIIAKQFVMGRDITEALSRAKPIEQKGYRYSYDMLGEAARTMLDAERYYQAYAEAIIAIGHAYTERDHLQSAGISIKLSALHPRYEFSQRERILQELPPKVLALALLAKRYNIGFTIDAEEADRLDLSLDVIEAVFSDPQLDNWQGFGLAVQAYQKRAAYVIDYLIALAAQCNKRLMVRLVKGAYWDSEIKHAQEQGFDNYPVFTRKANTDINYLACAKKMLAATDTIYPQFATHNAHSVASIFAMLPDSGRSNDDFEFQCLHGMGETLYDQIVANQMPCRIYAPVGKHKDLLPYLVRRLLENGANSSFVNRIVDRNLPIETVVADPIAYVRALTTIPHPNIPLPAAIYGHTRVNSRGVDFSNKAQQQTLNDALQPLAKKTDWLAAPTTGVGETKKPVISPTDNSPVGNSISASVDDMRLALDSAETALPTWQKKSIIARAAYLKTAAELLQQQQVELISLLNREAGKTLPDCISEIREAIDFCRYYAQQAETLPEHYQARGIALCISPWNFPLAIFLGQIAAALVAGNCVLAKPAEPTTLIAAFTVKLLHQAGIPKNVLQLVPGRGSVIGKQLISDPRISIVMFTGSTETAQTINKSLAARGGYDVPFIAETGGQNIMIVDSSALPEQVIDDVILSAFGSAGQRCSALRILCVQDDIADNLITMLKGAMQEVTIGDPLNLANDVGPVIDNAAETMLNAHAERMTTEAKFIAQVTLPEHLNGHFFAPRAFEINSLSQLTGEVFGPILHVLRYSAKQLPKLLDNINGLGFGLTMGIHSRINAKAAYIHRYTRVGNTYINRNMIGAVVGVQPFGGEGLSGTGPKAGGPHYVPRLMRNTALPTLTYFTEASAATASHDSKAIQAAFAQADNQIWAAIPVTDRANYLSHALSQLKASSNTWQKQLPSTTSNQMLLNCIASCYDLATIAIKTLSAPQILPGPTGEHNQLELHPRGLVLCIASEQTAITSALLQCVVALLSGNRVIMHVPARYQALLETLRDAFIQAKLPATTWQVIVAEHTELETVLTDISTLDAVMYNGQAEGAKIIYQQLAKRQGKLVPLILPDDAADYFCRLSCERTVTEDITAKGGNAALLSLEE